MVKTLETQPPLKEFEYEVTWIVWYYGKEKNGEKNDVSSTTLVPLYFASKFA